MTWYLIVFFAGSVSVEPMPSKLACEELRTVITAQYGRGSSFITATCASTNDGSERGKK